MLSRRKFMPVLFILLIAALACNAPTLTRIEPVLASTPPEPPPEPFATTTAPVSHISFPTDVQTKGTILYDVDSPGTAPEHRAPYGEAYRINRFERPFTQQVMDYLPDIDIIHFRINSDDDWHFFFVELIGNNPNNQLQPNYGIEVDVDIDGNGDYLIWTAPPFTTAWTSENVKVYSDSNEDTGGLSPSQSDAPFNGNGYDTLVFNGGEGSDPDLAWVRIDPQKANVLQFAIKRSALGNVFMWEAWADAGLKDVTKFSYNDYFTEVQAGSSVRDNVFYPIKQVYAVDNTCRDAVGFEPTGNEPLICNFDQPKPTREPNVPPPPVCIPAITYVGCK